MPFGLATATATFQRTMEIALAGLQWTSCLIYLDDVVVFGRTFDEHLCRLDAVLSRIARAGLKLKPSKCHFFQKEVTFLGHVVSADGVRPDPGNTSKLVNWPVPESVSDVRSFVGFATYYRRFVANFAEVAHPLTELTRKAIRFCWTSKCQDAFESLKKTLVSPDVMAYPLPKGRYTLDTDASQYAIGAVLSQEQNGVQRVIAYGSKTLGKSERNYCTTDRELLAIKHFLEHYKHYLLGRRFLVRTDHQPLRFLFSLKEPKDRTARWIEIMSSYDFAIEYRPGKKHGNADGMSRCPRPMDCECPVLTELDELKCGPCKKCVRKADLMRCELKKTYPQEISSTEPDLVRAVRKQQEPLSWCETLSSKQLSKLQGEDPSLKEVMVWLREGRQPTSREMEGKAPEIRHYWLQWGLLELREDVLYRKFHRKDNTGSHWQLVLPRKLHKQTLTQMHSSLLGGHLGRKKTREKTLQRYYWHGVRSDVDLWVAKCDDCESIKPPGKPVKAPLGKMPIGGIMDRLGTDILGPLPETPRGNKYILVVTDYFSKWVEILPVPDQTAVTCAEKILNEVIARFGTPLTIHSDQGRNYESLIFAELCRLLEIRKTRTSAGNPRCNGLTERYNRTLVRMIKAYIKDEQTDWDRYLGCLGGAYRATIQESTGLTPNLLMIGREVRLPAEVMFGNISSSSEEIQSYGEYVDGLRERMRHAHEVARIHLAAAAKRQRDAYDANVNLCRYAPGDLVWYRTEISQLKVAPKLRRPFEGPHVVIKKLSFLNYVIQLRSKGPRKVIHHNRLRPYRGEQRVSWAKAAVKRQQKEDAQRIKPP